MSRASKSITREFMESTRIKDASVVRENPS